MRSCCALRTCQPGQRTRLFASRAVATTGAVLVVQHATLTKSHERRILIWASGITLVVCQSVGAFLA